MEYNPRNMAEIARIYGEVSVFYQLVEKGIEPEENARNCLTALSSYSTTVPRDVRKALGINVKQLRERCEKELSHLIA